MLDFKCSTIAKNAGLIAGVVTILLLLPLTACAETPTPTPKPTRVAPTYDVEKAKADLEAARKLWEATGSDDYMIDLRAFLDLSFVPTRLTVRDGVVVSVEELRRNRPPIEPGETGIMTVDEMFDDIDSNLRSRPAYSLSAEYDPVHGFPTDYDVSWNYPSPEIIVFDAYFGGGFSNYQPLDPAPPAAGPEPASMPVAQLGPYLDSRVIPTVEEVMEKGLLPGNPTMSHRRRCSPPQLAG